MNNEFVPQAQRYSPAAHVSYIAGIERAQAHSAMLGCWDSCTCDAYRGRLNGLLSCASHEPTDLWWIAAHYALMSRTDATLIECRVAHGTGVDGLASTFSNATHQVIAGLVGNLGLHATVTHIEIRCGATCAGSNVTVLVQRIVPTK